MTTASATPVWPICPGFLSITVVTRATVLDSPFSAASATPQFNDRRTLRLVYPNREAVERGADAARELGFQVRVKVVMR